MNGESDDKRHKREEEERRARRKVRSNGGRRGRFNGLSLRPELRLRADPYTHVF